MCQHSNHLCVCHEFIHTHVSTQIITLYIGNIKTDICHRSLKNNDTDQSIDALFQCDHFVKLE